MTRLRSLVISPAELGRRGERRAVWFYRSRLFQVTERNFRALHGEVDLIARRGRLLVFIEVKTRQQELAGAGFEAVDRVKQLKIIRAAEEYLSAADRDRLQIRFDVLSLFWTGRRFRVQHFPSAFELRFLEGRPWRPR